MNAGRKALAAEFLGTTALLAAVVGSGIMAERLSPSNAGVALLANAFATGFALFLLITLFGPISGAHFNPVVTVLASVQREMPLRTAVAYGVVQLLGALAGVCLAHLMFDLPTLQESSRQRAGLGQAASEVFATTGLVATIAGFSRHAPAQVAPAVGVYIAAAYWVTASTSFANPAVTVARSFTDTFAGIALSDVAIFIAAQGVGLTAGLGLARTFWPSNRHSPISARNE